MLSYGHLNGPGFYSTIDRRYIFESYVGSSPRLCITSCVISLMKILMTIIKIEGWSLFIFACYLSIQTIPWTLDILWIPKVTRNVEYEPVLQRRLKMDRRRRFFGFWKWTEDEHKESSLIQIFFGDCKFFEYLRRCEYFQRKMEYSYKRQLEQILSAEELYIFWEKLNFKVLNF